MSHPDTPPVREARGCVSDSLATPSLTRDRLLDSAERLFAERGFEGTSMRALTQAAGTSLSAANYHFGSKETLLAATLHRLIEPINRLRCEALEALRDATEGALEVEDVLEAYLRPLFQARASAPEGSTERSSLAARLYADPSGPVAELKRELLADVNARFLDAFAQALPDRDPEVLAVSQQLTIGMVVHVMNGHVEVARFGSLLDVLIAHAAAGLRSTPPAKGREVTP
jgi:AcrR family transcriptional regulator